MKRRHLTTAYNCQQHPTRCSTTSNHIQHVGGWCWPVLLQFCLLGQDAHNFLFFLFLFIFPKGETSAGKSSLINLLLNEEVLPTCVLQNTLTICEISYGPRKEAKIHFNKYKPGEEPIRLKGKEFDQMRKYIEQPVDGERRCEKIEIKINNALLKVQKYSDGTR